MSLFKIDSPFNQGLANVFDIIILNLLWMICSVPIITIGASTTALYYSMLKINRERDYGVVRMFFHSFCQNFKQSIVMTLIVFLSGAFIYIDIQVFKSMDGVLSNLAMMVLLLLFIVWSILVSYTFPLLAQFENRTFTIFRNAFILGISNLLCTVVIVLLNSIPFVLFLRFPYIFILSLPIWLMFGVGMIAYINSNIFIKIFDQYIEINEWEGKKTGSDR